MDKGIGHPASTKLNGLEITLFFNQKFQNGMIYSLEVSNLNDLSGNTMETVQTPFSWYKAAKFDVVFNEIYPDPSPSFGLPKYEYI